MPGFYGIIINRRSYRAAPICAWIYRDNYRFDSIIVIILPLFVAFVAIDRSVITRLERYLGLHAAFGADHGEHLFGAVAGAFAGSPALRAAGRIVPEPFLGVEFLLRRGKSELPAAFLAGENPVFKSHYRVLLLK